MGKRGRWLIGVAGGLMLLIGLLCHNYTKPSDIERHTQVAQEHGWPPPSTGIVYLGMLFAPLGGGLLGFAIGRRSANPPMPTS